MQRGIKHLVKCRCMLQQYKSLRDPPRHQFVVFSIINDDDDTVQVKHAQCNNCGLIHKVIDICSSEILKKEELSSLTTISDIKDTLPENIRNLLDRNNVDLPTWEHVSFIFQNKCWGDFVVMTSEYDSGVRHGKYVQILGENLFKVDSFSREEYAK